MLVRGSRIAVTARGALSLETGRWPEFTPGYPPSLRLGNREMSVGGYEAVYDLAVAGERVAALVEGDTYSGESGKDLAITTLAFAPLDVHRVPSAVERVAITSEHVFLASRAEVAIHDGAPIHGAAIDLAASSSELAILDADGVTFFDARGVCRGQVTLFAPSAIALDRIAGGWLAAVDGGIVHFDGDAAPRLVAPVAEPVQKVRRGPDAIYVLASRELRAIRGDRVEVIGRLDDNAWYWNDVDAGPEGMALHSKLRE